MTEEPATEATVGRTENASGDLNARVESASPNSRGRGRGRSRGRGRGRERAAKGIHIAKTVDADATVPPGKMAISGALNLHQNAIAARLLELRGQLKAEDELQAALRSEITHAQDLVGQSGHLVEWAHQEVDSELHGVNNARQSVESYMLKLEEVQQRIEDHLEHMDDMPQELAKSQIRLLRLVGGSKDAERAAFPVPNHWRDRLAAIEAEAGNDHDVSQPPNAASTPSPRRSDHSDDEASKHPSDVPGERAPPAGVSPDSDGGQVESHTPSPPAGVSPDSDGGQVESHTPSPPAGVSPDSDGGQVESHTPSPPESPQPPRPEAGMIASSTSIAALGTEGSDGNLKAQVPAIFRKWADLMPAEREMALALGFTEDHWNSLRPMTEKASTAGSEVRGNPSRDAVGPVFSDKSVYLSATTSKKLARLDVLEAADITDGDSAVTIDDAENEIAVAFKEEVDSMRSELLQLRQSMRKRIAPGASMKEMGEKTPPSGSTLPPRTSTQEVHLDERKFAEGSNHDELHNTPGTVFRVKLPLTSSHDSTGMGFALGVNDDNRIIVTSVSEFVQQHTSIRPGNQVISIDGRRLNDPLEPIPEHQLADLLETSPSSDQHQWEFQSDVASGQCGFAATANTVEISDENGAADTVETSGEDAIADTVEISDENAAAETIEISGENQKREEFAHHLPLVAAGGGFGIAVCVSQVGHVLVSHVAPELQQLRPRICVGDQVISIHGEDLTRSGTHGAHQALRVAVSRIKSEAVHSVEWQLAKRAVS